MILLGKAAPAWICTAPTGIPLGSLPINSLIQIPVKPAFHSLFGQQVVCRLVDANHMEYPADSATLLSEYGLSLMCLDAREPNSPNEDHQFNGNNYYPLTNIAQWLNSTAAPGEWYQPVYPHDEAPVLENLWIKINPSAQLPGFLHIFESWFVSKLLTTNILNIRTDYMGGGLETVQAKVFLPSTTELNLPKENKIVEGTGFSSLSTASTRVCYLTPEAMANCTTTTEGPVAWWTRTPTYNDFLTRVTTNSGYRGTSTADNSAVAVRPMCNLPWDAHVSGPDSKDRYTLLP